MQAENISGGIGRYRRFFSADKCTLRTYFSLG